MIVVVLRTKPSGLYRDRRGLGLHRVGYKEEIYISELPSLPSMQRRVPPGHGTKSWILYLHSPTVRPKDIVRLSEDPQIQDSLAHIALSSPVYWTLADSSLVQCTCTLIIFHCSVVQVKGNYDDIWWTDWDERSWYELDLSCFCKYDDFIVPDSAYYE